MSNPTDIKGVPPWQRTIAGAIAVVLGIAACFDIFSLQVRVLTLKHLLGLAIGLYCAYVFAYIALKGHTFGRRKQ